MPKEMMAKAGVRPGRSGGEVTAPGLRCWPEGCGTSLK